MSVVATRNTLKPIKPGALTPCWPLCSAPAVVTVTTAVNRQRSIRLEAEGCTTIRSEKVSGASRDGRPELATVLQFLRAGDELGVTRLDRLGRDTRDVLNIVHECEQRGASVTVLGPSVTTKGDMGHVVMTVLGMVAQMERRFIKERQREGIARAKADGGYFGGARRIDRRLVAESWVRGASVKEIAKAVGSRMQVYRILKSNRG